MTIRLCRICAGWHDLGDSWPQACAGHFAPSGASLQIIRDIEPYKSVAADVNGKRATIGGRRQHREFLQRNNYVEVGTDPMTPRAPQIDTVKGHEIKAVIDHLQNRRR